MFQPPPTSPTSGPLLPPVGGMGLPPIAPAGGNINTLNSAALMGMQGAAPKLPPNYSVDIQPDGTLLLKETHPDGTSNVVKVISPPKKTDQTGAR